MRSVFILFRSFRGRKGKQEKEFGGREGKGREGKGDYYINERGEERDI
jgi:hypothetical protein